MDGVELNHHGVLLEHIEHIEHSEPSEEQLKKDWMGVSWTPVTPVGKNGSTKERATCLNHRRPTLARNQRDLQRPRLASLSH